MTGKYILVLGAGLMQRPAIQAVKELGYLALVVDANDKAVCVKEADRFEKIDLKDREGLSSFALSMKDKLSAVFTAGTDFSASVSYVASKCGLKSHTFDSALCASDKIKMRNCFKRDGVSSPSFREVTDKDNLSKISIDKYPMVIKPVDNMGARGCRMIRSEKEKDVSIKAAVEASRSGRAILEDYMEGNEYSIDALVCDGNLTITGFADRHIFYPPYFIEMGHTMPTCVDDKKRNELIDCFADAVHSLGLTHGAAKADIKYTEKGPMIGEIAGRLSGGYMSGWTYPYASGFKLTKNAVEISLDGEGEELKGSRVHLDIDNRYFKIYEVKCKKSCAERAWISIPGTIKQVYGLEESERIKGVKDVLPRTEIGDKVIFPINNVSKCGNVIALKDSYEEAAETAEKAVGNIVLRLDENDRTTLDFLERSEIQAEEGFPPYAYEIDLKDVDRNKYIETNVSFENSVPDCVKPYVDNTKDFNHRTIRESLLLLENFYTDHPRVSLYKFWQYMISGGLQGVLYLLDSLSKEDER